MLMIDFITICKPPLPPSAVCDFEDDGLCGFDQDVYDDFDWTRMSGGTNSSMTGPKNDHTYGTANGGPFCISYRTNRNKLGVIFITICQLELEMITI